jgi:hypothetical protein
MKKYNEWNKLKKYSVAVQMRVTAICCFKALTHWQTLIALIIFVVVAYVSNKIGIATGFKIGIFNLIGLLGAAFGALFFGTVMNKHAIRHLDDELSFYNRQDQ